MLERRVCSVVRPRIQDEQWRAVGDQDRETESKTKNPQETQELSNSSQIVQGVDPEADSTGAKGKRGAGCTDGSDDRVQAQNNDVQPTAWKVAGRVDVANMDAIRAVRTGHVPDGGVAVAGPGEAGPDEAGPGDGVETIDGGCGGTEAVPLTLQQKLMTAERAPRTLHREQQTAEWAPQTLQWRQKTAGWALQNPWRTPGHRLH